MNPTRRALLDAVLAAPDDDLPRLVFADWLQENGEGVRAEFIRSQVHGGDPVAPPLTLCFDVESFLGQQPDECFRVGMNPHALTDEVLALAIRSQIEDRVVHWRRGFIHTLHGPLAVLLEHGPAIVRDNPVERTKVQGVLGDNCPICDGPGQWRTGINYDHEKICMRTAHAIGGNIVWEPGGLADDHIDFAVLAELRRRAKEDS